MGRLLLLLVAGAAIGAYVLTASAMDRAGRDAGVAAHGQSRALARGAAEAAQAVVLGDLVDPATGRFRLAPAVTSFGVGGGRASVEPFEFSDGNREVTVRVAAVVGTAAHRITSTYRLRPADWPGALVLQTPYATASAAPGAVVVSGGGDRGVYVDVTRFDDYGLASVLSDGDLAADLSAALSTDPVLLRRGAGMDAVRDQFGAPTTAEILGRVEGDAGATRIVGGLTVSGTQRYGNPGDARDPDPQVVHVEGDLRVPFGSTLEGNGVLVVEGGVRVEGAMTWEGLVVVAPPAGRQHVEVDLGDAVVRGSVLVDQEAPPPGGHTDLTVFRSLDGTWAHPAGDGGRRPGGKPVTPSTWSGPVATLGNPDAEFHYEHTHRIDQPSEPGRPRLGHREFLFSATTGEQQAFTRFRETVDALRAAHPGGLDVVVEFVNPEAHGAARFELAVAGDTTRGGVVSGFGAFAAPGQPHTSRPFALDDLESIRVDVRSLRMLAHLFNENATAHPECVSTWAAGPFATGCFVTNRVAALSHLRDRDGALTVRLRDAHDPSKWYYDASLYWHRKEEGDPRGEHKAEVDADDAWRAAIRGGTAGYGTVLRLGDRARVELDRGHVQTATARLGLAGLAVEHVRSHGESVRPGDVR